MNTHITLTASVGGVLLIFVNQIEAIHKKGDHSAVFTAGHKFEVRESYEEICRMLEL